MGNTNRLLFSAIRRNNPEAVKRELGLGIDPNEIWYGRRPIIEAVRAGSAEIVAVLLEAGAKVDSTDDIGNTAIRDAASCNFFDIFMILMKAGADTRRFDQVGTTLLHNASRCGGLDIMKVLIDQGADLNARDIHGRTPLIFSAMAGEIDAMDLLIESGAKTDVKDRCGQTASDVLEHLNPDKYIQWTKRRILDIEDSANITCLRCEPDFSL